MTRILLAISVICIVLLAAFAGSGCIFSPDKEPPKETQNYVPQTTPENVLVNLQVSYRRREITQYAKLLHPEFIFKFQTVDIENVGKEFWTRDEDSTKTANLFEADPVTEIKIDLTYGRADDDIDIDMEPGTKHIRVNPTFLEVEETLAAGNTTFRVDGDIQDMFFVRGAEADSTTWYLWEWRDLPSGSGSGAPGLGPDSEGVSPSGTTWGRLKSDPRG
jgi:hypothetical protein